MKPEDIKKILQDIKKIKKEHTLSNEWIAAKIGISVFTLQRIFSGNTKIPNKSTLKLFNLFIRAHKEAKEKDKLGKFLTLGY